MQTGDILTTEELDYIHILEGLWDDISNLIEGRRLEEADIPDDYQALIKRLQECEKHRARADVSGEELTR